MSDVYEGFTANLSAPASSGVAVTPSDSTVLMTTRAVWVGTQGDLAVKMKNGSTVTVPNAVGLLPIRVTQVLSTGTTASGIVAFW